jgi:Protein of unknown function (DUF692)
MAGHGSPGSKRSARTIPCLCTVLVFLWRLTRPPRPPASRSCAGWRIASSLSSSPNTSPGRSGTGSIIPTSCLSPAPGRRLCASPPITQDALGRAILIENPSHYLPIDGHEWSEIEFLTELCRRTGCGLLVDVNNIFVSANNLQFSAEAYVDALPVALIGEIHVAGHSLDPRFQAELLIDSHDAPVSDAVWALLARLIGRSGARPVLIERDNAIPEFAELLAEREQALAILRAAESVAAA